MRVLAEAISAILIFLTNLYIYVHLVHNEVLKYYCERAGNYKHEMAHMKYINEFCARSGWRTGLNIWYIKQFCGRAKMLKLDIVSKKQISTQ